MSFSPSSAGSILSAGAAFQQADAAYSAAGSQRSALQYQASVASTNAIFASMAASDAVRNGQKAEENQDLKTGQIISSQRAALAANGVDLGEGSPNDILATSKFMGKRDALQIHDNAMLQAWGYRTQQDNYTVNSKNLSRTADTISPANAAFTSLLTSANSVASKWDMLAKVNGTPDFGTTLSNKWAGLFGKG